MTKIQKCLPGDLVDYKPMDFMSAAWPVLRDLRIAQKAIGLKAGDVNTIQTLLSFLKGQQHSMVFASNRTILERSGDGSERTLQRRIKRFVSLGLLYRRDSPNKKKYGRRGADPSEMLAYGFDLSPILHRADEIARIAKKVRADSAKIAQLRSIYRSLINQIDEAGMSATVDNVHRLSLRRVLSAAQLEALITELQQAALKPVEPSAALIPITAHLTASDSQNVGHHHMSDKDISLKDRTEKEDRDISPMESQRSHDKNSETYDEQDLADLATEHCPDAFTYTEAAPNYWPEMRSFAFVIASWIGIAPSAISDACAHHGPNLTALTILGIAQGGPMFLRPGAYFRSITSLKGKNFDPVNFVKWITEKRARAKCSSHVNVTGHYCAEDTFKSWS